jgi:hypothetical protein
MIKMFKTPICTIIIFIIDWKQNSNNMELKTKSTITKHTICSSKSQVVPFLNYNLSIPPKKQHTFVVSK